MILFSQNNEKLIVVQIVLQVKRGERAKSCLRKKNRENDKKKAFLLGEIAI